jgi:hypothetical protein
MDINKITSANYIVSLGPYDSGTSSWTGTMTINGNLAIVGNVTYISDLAINDAFIIVAANNTGTVTSMGMIAQKSSTTWAGLRYNTIVNEWETSPSVTINGAPITPYAPIGSAAAGNTTEIQFNNAGSFDGNANLTYDYTTSKLTLAGYEVLGNIGTTPSAPSNAVAMYNKAQGTGGTGLYVVSSTVNDEVVSYTKARLYSIIF